MKSNSVIMVLNFIETSRKKSAIVLENLPVQQSEQGPEGEQVKHNNRRQKQILQRQKASHARNVNFEQRQKARHGALRKFCAAVRRRLAAMQPTPATMQAMMPCKMSGKCKNIDAARNRTPATQPISEDSNQSSQQRILMLSAP
jgi:hypothetical protein